MRADLGRCSSVENQGFSTIPRSIWGKMKGGGGAVKPVGYIRDQRDPQALGRVARNCTNGRFSRLVTWMISMVFPPLDAVVF